MIGYSFLDEPPHHPIKRSPVKQPKKMQKPPVKANDTECNYILMFFVISVIALSIIDGLKIR